MMIYDLPLKLIPLVSILSSLGNVKTDGCESFASCMREWTSNVTYKYFRGLGIFQSFFVQICGHQSLIIEETEGGDGFCVYDNGRVVERHLTMKP